MTVRSVVRSYGFRVAVLLVGALIVYLAGIGQTPLFDRDEPRYAIASRQMVQSGDWVIPTYLDELRVNKPIFIYWCQAASMKLLGPTVFAARLPSVIAMVLTLGLLAVVTRYAVGRARAWWTCFILATPVLVLWAAKTTLTDAVLLLWITTAQLCLYLAWRGRGSWPVMIVMGLAIGLALLTKGPVVLGFMATTVLVLAVLQWLTPARPRELVRSEPESRVVSTSLKCLVVAGLAAAVVLPWLIAIEQRIPGYTLQTLGTEVVQRGKVAQEGHTGPPGFYAALIWFTWFPWSLLLPAAIVCAVKRRGNPAIRFALAAVIGPWLLLEVYTTKLPHYLLPAYPFLAVLTADMLLRAARGRIRDLSDKPFLIAALIFGVALTLTGVGGVVLPIVLGGEGVLLMLVAVLMAAAYAAVAFLGVRQFADRRPTRAAIVLGVGTGLLSVIAWTLYFPNARFLNLSSRIGELLRQHGATQVGDVRMVDYKEGSLAFYQGGTIREQSDEFFLRTTPADQWPRWLVVTPRLWSDTQKVPAEAVEAYEEIARDRGINLGEGELYEVVVLRRRR